MQEVIKVEQLAKSYGKLRAVEHISLAVDRGMVFGLLGANGAGKSTTIECILGTKRADTGTVRILGADPVQNRKELFEKVGVQFQESSYQEQITVAELCRVTASLYKKSADPFALPNLELQIRRKILSKTYLEGRDSVCSLFLR